MKKEIPYWVHADSEQFWQHIRDSSEESLESQYAENPSWRQILREVIREFWKSPLKQAR